MYDNSTIIILSELKSSSVVSQCLTKNSDFLNV